MTAINDNVYYDHLDKIVEKYNNTVNRSIKMKPINVKNSDNKTYVVTPNKQSAKFKINDLLRIPQFKNVFAKGYSPNLSKEIFKISIVKNMIHGHMKLVIGMEIRFEVVFIRKNYYELMLKIINTYMLVIICFNLMTI